MQEPTHYSLTAYSYARAILELADEQKLSLDEIGTELESLRELVESDETFRLYLADPSIGHEQRGELLKRVLGGRVAPLIMQVMGVLNEKGRLSMLREIAGAFGDLLDEKLGKVEVDLIVAQKLTPEQLNEATKKISQALKREAVVHAYVDENIIGGIVLRMGDQLIDASVKYQLQSLKERLLSAKPS